MKHLKTLLFASVLFIGATSLTAAQSQIAHINKQELIKAMPAYTQAQMDIEKMSKTYETEIQNSLKELDKKLKQYTAEEPTKTNEENQARMQEVEGIKQSLGEYQQHVYSCFIEP